MKQHVDVQAFECSMKRNQYGPHSGLDEEGVRVPFWGTLEEHVAKIPAPEPVYVTGDFNVRFQATHKHDQGVTGPYTYGKGKRYIDHSASSNRSLCIGTMSRLNMLEVASYRTPSPIHHITYRDKTAPPKDWSQFLLDPLILQQFYDKLHFEFYEASLGLAAHIRSFLELPDLLTPPKTLPQADPVLFQRLDHTFTTKQWLNSICSCQSKLHTGFPSDHYLLVTEVGVRLQARTQKPPRPPQLNILSSDRARKEFNAVLADLLDDADHSSDHNAEVERVEVRIVYTDGSGSQGRCSRRTPAGCLLQSRADSEDAFLWLSAT